MSKVATSQRNLQASEDNSIITKFGEEPKENISWTKRLEKNLFTIFSVIVEEQRISTFFGFMLMSISFIQTAALIYGQGTFEGSEDIFREDLISFIDVFYFYRPVSHSGNKSFFLLVAYALFSIQVLYFLTLFGVYAYSASEKKYYYFIVQVACVLTPILYWVLLIPTAHFFSSVFNCNPDTQMHAYIATMECWGTEHIVHICAFSIFFVFYLINMLLICTLANDCNPYNSANAFTRFPWSFELFYAFMGLIFSLEIQHVAETPYRWISDSGILLCATYLTFVYRQECLYYNQIIQTLFGTCTISLIWICYIDVLFEVAMLAGYNFRGRAIAMFIGLCFAFYFARKLKVYNIENLVMYNNLVHIEDEAISERYIHHMISLTGLLEQDLVSEYESNFILGYLYMHKQECAHPSCPMNNHDDYYIPLTHESAKKQLTDKVRLKYLFHRIYHYKVKKDVDRRNSYTDLTTSANSSRLILAFAHYQIWVIGNLFKASYLLEEASRMSEAFWCMQAVNRAKRLLLVQQDTLNQKRQSLFGNSDKRESLDVRLVLEYEAHLARLKKKLVHVAELQRKFCSELLLPQPDLNNVYKIGMQIIEACETAGSSWDQLHSMECNDPKAEVLYGLYLSNVRGKEDEAKDHVRMAKLIGDKLADTTDLLKTKQSMFAEGTAVIAIGTGKEDIGKIIKANNGITNLFEYAPGDIIGKDVSLLMPQFLGKHHNSYISSYLNTGKCTTLNKVTETYGIDKENYVFTIYLYIREYYSLQYGTVFLGLLRPCPREEATILTDLQGKILGISYDAYINLSELNPVMLREQEIYLFYICPNFSEELQGKDYGSFEGSTTLTFSVPKNVQSISLAVSTKYMLYSSENVGKARVSVEDLFRKNYSATLDYEGCETTKKWCSISTKKVGYGQHSFKVITFNKFDYKADNDISSAQGRDIEPILDQDYYDFKGEVLVRPRRSSSKNSSSSSSNNRVRTHKLRDIVSNNVMVKQAVLSLFAKDKRREQYTEETKWFGQGENEQEENKISLMSSEPTRMRLIEKHSTKADQHEDFNKDRDDQKSVSTSIEKEINNIRNSSFTNYTPKPIMYAHWAVTVFLFLVLVTVIVTYAVHRSVFGHIETLLNVISRMRIKEAVSTYESLKYVSLLTPADDGKPLLDVTKRSNYNYGTIGHPEGTVMNYTEWIMAELLNSTYKLNEYKNYIQMEYIDITSERSRIFPSNVTWIFKNSDGTFKKKSLYIHSAFAMLENEALRIHGKVLQNLECISKEAELITLNWFSGILVALQSSGRMTLGLIQDVLDNSMLMSLILLSTFGTITALCLAGFVPLLYYIANDTSEMLEFFTKITGTNLRSQIENCTKFVNLLSFESGTGEGRDHHEQENYEESLNEEENEESDQNNVNEEDPLADSSVKKPRRENNHKKRHKNNRTFTKYKGSFWVRFIKLFLVFVVINSYGIYCYFSPPAFFNQVDQHTKEMDSYIRLVVYNEVVYMMLSELLVSNWTTTFRDKPLGFLPSRNYLSNLVDSTSELHRTNKAFYTNRYNRVFHSIYYFNACSEAVVQDISECATINDGVLGNGLSLANHEYIDMLQHSFVEFTTKSPAQRTLDFIRTVLNSNMMIKAEKLNKKYFLPLYRHLLETARSSVEEAIFTQKVVFSLMFGAYILVIVLLYLIVWKLYANGLRRDLFSSKLLFSYLPLDMIVDNRALAEKVVEYAKSLMADIRNQHQMAW
eukprot:TRINITY_DN181_c0_g1_i2.p1 TRINITY_DN181_c0_g1~~TRINITY_DN181_c0_g1_i2.p1  ORF type:complete len:1753 (+),score=112.22 TRINITY_DN181_c0_g1_i2:94-5259(+)